MAQEAYDYLRFQEQEDNTAPVLDPQIHEQPQHNVVEMPEQPEQPEHQPQPKPRRNLFKRIAAALCFGLIFATAISAVHNEVLLHELTKKISDTSRLLEEAESLEIQLNMQAAQKMTDAEVEEYAVQHLGMSKLSNAQVTYLHVAGQDQGRVVQDIEGQSWVDKTLSALREWLAG